MRSPGKFIGKGGANLHALQSRTRTKIYGRGRRDERSFIVYYHDERSLESVNNAARA